MNDGMTWLDGVGYKYSGARGLMAVDSLANGIGGVLLLFTAYYARVRLQAPRNQAGQQMP